MILNNFTYKPRLITQISRDDFESCGFDFKDFISKILSARNNEVTPFPDDGDHELLVSFSAIDRRNEYLGKFRFNFESESRRSTVELNLNFPKRTFEFSGDNYEIDRGLDGIFLERAFPNSAETIGYCFGNFHINAEFWGLFDDGKFSINFDTEGNYLPLSAYNYDTVYRQCDIILPSLTYPEGMDLMNPTDLDKMFIPELSSAVYGTYVFWLDRFHIVSVKDTKRMGSHAQDFHCVEPVMRVSVSNTFRNIFGERYRDIPDFNKVKISDKQKDQLLSDTGLFDSNMYNMHWQEYHSLGLTRDGLFSKYQQGMKTSFLDISTVRTVLDPIERKALEILEVVNANPDKYRKLTLFPSSSKKIAEATAPLVSLTSQIVRSTKAFAMEEV
jgi:hypothetical protein